MIKKIAVPSNDGTNISEHFGMSPTFVVFETENGAIVGKETRGNAQEQHEPGECHGAGEHNPTHGHNHAGMAEVLKDCETILCRGMGRRAAESLKEYGIVPLLVQTELPAEEAVLAYLAGSLPTGGSFCHCQH